VEFDSMAVLVSVAAGLIGTLVGAAITWYLDRRQNRLETTFTLYREFNAPEMTRSRSLAPKTVRNHSKEHFDDMRGAVDSEEMRHVWNILYFYQHLWLVIRYGKIHEKYVCEMFGENFYWWYIKSYQNQLIRGKENQEKWQPAHHIEALWKWFEGEADSNDRGRWKKRVAQMPEPNEGAKRYHARTFLRR
jgi:hypothetical protein